MPAIPLTGNEEALDYTLRIVRNGKNLKPEIILPCWDSGSIMSESPGEMSGYLSFCESGDAWNERQNTFCSQQYYLCDIVVSVL